MKFKNPIIISLLLVGTSSFASAAVIAQQLGGAIDPAGGEELDTEATGSALISTFNTLSDKVIQANFSGVGGTTGNTIDGPDVDVRIDHSAGSFSASPSAGGSSAFNSSSVGNAYQWSGTNGQQLTISFGTQGGSFSADRTVEAAGLMLTNFGGAYTGVTITYFDSSNAVLSTQNFTGGPDVQGTGNGGDFFTGYVSSSPNIASLTVDIARNSGNSNIALDALTYVVPEPSSAAMLGLGIIGLLLRRNRVAA